MNRDVLVFAGLAVGVGLIWHLSKGKKQTAVGAAAGTAGAAASAALGASPANSWEAAFAAGAERAVSDAMATYGPFPGYSSGGAAGINTSDNLDNSRLFDPAAQSDELDRIRADGAAARAAEDEAQWSQGAGYEYRQGA